MLRSLETFYSIFLAQVSLEITSERYIPPHDDFAGYDKCFIVRNNYP